MCSGCECCNTLPDEKPGALAEFVACYREMLAALALVTETFPDSEMAALVARARKAGGA